MKSEGSCLPGGPLNGNPPPLPTRAVPFRQPADVKPTPLPARRDGSRDYIRRWARSHGFHVYAVGALPKKVLDAYAQALKEA